MKNPALLPFVVPVLRQRPRASLLALPWIVAVVACAEDTRQVGKSKKPVNCGKPSTSQNGKSYASTTTATANTPSFNIVGGSNLAEADPRVASSVGFGVVTAQGGVATCTGFLVSSDLIITAAHCLDFGRPRYVYFGQSLPSNVRRDVLSGEAHPNYNKEDRNGLNNDIAWLKFSGGLPNGFQPIRVWANHSVLSKGMATTLVGYGVTGSKNGDPGNRLAVDTIFDRYVKSSEYNSLIVVGPTPNKGSCFGDSGGANFIKMNGAWYALGTLHGVDGSLNPGLDPDKPCESGQSIYTHVAPHRPWIEQSSGVKILDENGSSQAAPIKVLEALVDSSELGADSLQTAQRSSQDASADSSAGKASAAAGENCD